MADPVLQSPTNPHFFTPLLPGFHSHLNIPDKFFSLHIEGKHVRKTVELRSDACETTWQVMMEGRRLTVGWKEFAVAHNFRAGDIIIFRQSGDFVFHVTGFGPTCSEIQYVQSCNLEDEDDENMRNLETKQNLKTEPKLLLEKLGKPPRKKQVKKRNLEVEAVSFASDQSCFIRYVTESNLQEDALALPKKLVDLLDKRKKKIVLTNGEGIRTWTLALRFKKSSRTFYMRGGWKIFCHENGLELGDWVTFKLENNNTKTPRLCFSTAESKNVFSPKDNSKGKRMETGESSRRLSLPSLNENRFVTLKVTPDTFRNCRILFPVRFTRANGLETEGGKTITLLDKRGVAWPVNLIMVRDSTIRLASGLTEFLKANGIKAYESFVLELVWEDRTSPPMLKFCSKKIKT